MPWSPRVPRFAARVLKDSSPEARSPADDAAEPEPDVTLEVVAILDAEDLELIEELPPERPARDDARDEDDRRVSGIRRRVGDGTRRHVAVTEILRSRREEPTRRVSLESYRVALEEAAAARRR